VPLLALCLADATFTQPPASNQETFQESINQSIMALTTGRLLSDLYDPFFDWPFTTRGTRQQQGQSTQQQQGEGNQVGTFFGRDHLPMMKIDVR